MSNDIKDHEIDCDACRQFQKESKLEKAFRQVLNTDVRKIIKEEWQITTHTIQRVDRIEKIITWLIIAHIVELFGLILLILKIYDK